MHSFLSTPRLDSFSWILIYSGLFSLAIGLDLQRSADTLLVPALVWGGSMCCVAGAVLIWLRSKRPDADAAERTTP